MFFGELALRRYPTTVGIIHSSKDGSHIVPARPKEFKGE